MSSQVRRIQKRREAYRIGWYKFWASYPGAIAVGAIAAGAVLLIICN